MERLTYRSPEFKNPVSRGACKGIDCSFDCDSCKINDLITKLCAYEDTGLEPEEIKNALDVNDIMPEINVTVDQLRDLLQAEQDGRLVVLPFKKGSTLLDYSDPERPELLYNFRIAVAYDHCGIVFHQPFNIFMENVKRGYISQLSKEAEAALAEKGGRNEQTRNHGNPE